MNTTQKDVNIVYTGKLLLQYVSFLTNDCLIKPAPLGPSFAKQHFNILFPSPWMVLMHTMSWCSYVSTLILSIYSFLRAVLPNSILPTWNSFPSHTYPLKSLTKLSTKFCLSISNWNFITHYMHICSFLHVHVHSSLRHHLSYFSEGTQVLYNHRTSALWLTNRDVQARKKHCMPICSFQAVQIYSN